MNERLLGEAIRKGIANAVNPINKRLQILEDQHTQLVVRRVIDAHIVGEILKHERQDQKDSMLRAIKRVANGLKVSGDFELDNLINQQIDEWIERLK